MSIPASTILLQTKSALNQAGNMTLAAVPDGLGGFTMQNDDVLLYHANRAVEWVTENAYALRGKAQGTLAVGTRTVQLQSLTSDPGQGKLWAALRVNYGGKLLARVDEGRLDTAEPGKEFLGSGTPGYWFDSGQADTIGVDPAPSDGTKTLTVVGLCYPLPLALTATAGVTTAELSFMRDPLILQTIPTLAAMFAARKAFDDPTIYGRLGDLVPMAQDTLTRLYNDLTNTVQWRFPNPPVLGEGMVAK